MVKLRYHGHLAEFGYGKYIIVHFLVSFDGISRLGWFRRGYFGSTKSSPNTWKQGSAQPNSSDMRQKRARKVRLGINSLFVQFVVIIMKFRQSTRGHNSLFIKCDNGIFE